MVIEREGTRWPSLREVDLRSIWQRLLLHFDWTLLLLTILVATLGLTNLYSATRHAPQRGFFGQQTWFLAIGLATYLLMAVVDYRVWLRFAWMILFLGFLAIIFVHFAGSAAKGSRRWLGVGDLGGQPSEFLKLAVILALARLAHDSHTGEQSTLRTVMGIVGIHAAILLVAWQPDLGTASLLALIALSVALLAGKKAWPIWVEVGLASAAFPLIWSYFLKDYQKKRIMTFLDPSHDPSGAGWNARQSILAIGSGRWTGKGYMQGTQNKFNFLPEQWTDFPFSVWAEEWGFIGALALIVLYFFLILWILNIGSQARDRFGATLTIGVATMFFWQVVVNIAMVSGLAPVVGITLPLFSKGGSSVLSMLAGLGMVASVSIRRWTQ